MITEMNEVNSLLGELFKKVTGTLIPDINCDSIDLGYTTIDQDNDIDGLYLRFEYYDDLSLLEIIIDYCLPKKIGYIDGFEDEINYKIKHMKSVNIISNFIFSLILNRTNIEDAFYHIIGVISRGDKIYNGYYVYHDQYIDLKNKIQEYLDMSDAELELYFKFI